MIKIKNKSKFLQYVLDEIVDKTEVMDIIQNAIKAYSKDKENIPEKYYDDLCIYCLSQFEELLHDGTKYLLFI